MASKKPDKAIGMKRVPGGWTVVEYEILDGKVVKQKLTEPDLRDIASQRFEVAVSNLMASDD